MQMNQQLHQKMNMFGKENLTYNFLVAQYIEHLELQVYILLLLAQ